MNYELYTDGAVTKNPGGTASYGFVLYADGKQLSFGYGIVGSSATMNNVLAEYYAVSQGIAEFMRIWDQPNSSLTIYNDSQFVVSQIYKDRILGPRLQQMKQYLDVKVVWVSREMNSQADDLAKRLRQLDCQRIPN
jgi:ribonuclease HI